MNHSNTAFWTNPMFDFGIFYPFFLEIPKDLYVFTFSNSPDPCRSPLIWVWTIWRKLCGFSTGVYWVKRVKKQMFFGNEGKADSFLWNNL